MKKIFQRMFIKGFCIQLMVFAVMVFTAGCRPDNPAGSRPNIVMVLLDDLPYATISALGNEIIETPNIDQLMNEGIFYDRAYSEVLCAPSRFTVFSGWNAARHGHTNVGGQQYIHALMQEPELEIPFGPGDPNLAQFLKQAGYTTAISGKWHMPGVPVIPEYAGNCGFDFTWPADHREPYKDLDKITDNAIAFLKQQNERPFFLYVAHYAPHGPQEVPAEDLKKWKERFPDKDNRLLQLMATVDRIDSSVGKLLGVIDDLGLRENTLFCLASDNGGYALEKYSELNKPFRGGKGSLYEGGIRVPVMIRWPGHIKAGSRCDTPVHFMDFLPTFCELAGANLPAGYPVDGQSILPLMTGDTIPDRFLVTHYPHYVMHWGTTPASAVIQDGFKLVVYHYDHVSFPGPQKDLEQLKYSVGKHVELYDLNHDIAEREDISDRFPEKVSKLEALLEAYLQETGARFPIPNNDYDPDSVTFNQRFYRLRQLTGSNSN